MSIECKQGVLWVTRAGDINDYLLAPGDRYVPEKKGKVVIQAVRDAHLCLTNN
jgi:hypothetical protein